MNIEHMSARALIRQMKKRALGAEEVTCLFLKRIALYGGADALNAVCEADEERAITAARALDASDDAPVLPLYGLPVLIKDNIDVKGLRTTAGSLALTDNIVARDADVVANLRAAGAVILGKTNLTEFANYTTQNMPGGYSSRAGYVKNAYNRLRSPSGSSSGSAVAMSASLCAAAVGTDTSFSVVGCATENGVVGFKPARGALSQNGIIPIAHTLDSAGALTRDLEDAVLLCAGMRAARGEPKPAARVPESLRVAINVFNKYDVSDEQMGYYEREFDKWRRAGITLSEVSHPYAPEQRAIMKYEFKHDLNMYLRASAARRKTLDEIVEYYEANPDTMLKYGDFYLRAALEASGNLDDAEYINALEARARLRAEVLPAMREYDACVMTGPTNIMHFMGLSSLALKMGLGKDGMPRGLILYGASEARLIEAALVIESMLEETPPPAIQ